MNKALVGGIIVAGIGGVLIAWWIFGGNTETTVTLSGSPCTVAKEAQITVKKGKKVTWAIQNDCTSAQTVSIGNFRVPGSTGIALDCSVGNDWPFKNQDRQVTIAPGKNDDIVLKEAKNTTGANRVLDYDFCLGGVKNDPRLIIEP